MKLFRSKPPLPAPEWKLEYYSRDQHTVSRNDISPNALKVLYRLHNAGYRSCLVGGGVRDILLGLHPKDFDIATDANPEQVKALFRNCRLIGRRFRLAHILFGREIIEVATFRGYHEKNSEGMILRDNVFGTIEEDAIRRDFTVNSLYYDIADFSVHDFCDGMADLDNRLMRIIGDPETRYQEDPVRMLRAIRLAVKLNLQLEEETAKPLKELSVLLKDIPSARLWDESHKLFLSGHSANTFSQLEKYQLLIPLLPQMCEALETNNNEKFRDFIQAALDNTDKRIRQNKSLNPAFLYACFLWQSVRDIASTNRSNGLHAAEAMLKAQATVLGIQTKSIAIPKRFTQVIREIWSMQHRLDTRRGKNLASILTHPRFRASYDFMLLRAGIGEVNSSLADWWTQIQKVDTEHQVKMIKDVAPKHRQRRKPRKKPTNKPPTSDGNS
ncbi:MAG: polynucleotide adenylyltransferase PcnB [Gammaproteobacteria bacterium]|nr:polynucleotide adenylyltransferase PcnB [Gammaproteobacteria bacterium]